MSIGDKTPTERIEQKRLLSKLQRRSPPSAWEATRIHRQDILICLAYTFHVSICRPQNGYSAVDVPSNHEALPQGEAIPLNNGILSRMEIEFGCVHKPHALIHL